jgi:hypothetical protein
VKWTWLLACVTACASGCADAPVGPVPGDTPPGAACAKPAECGCWSCTCVGIGGDPGAAQLCQPDGHCPSGAQACKTVCALADAQVATVTAIDRCPGVP